MEKGDFATPVKLHSNDDDIAITTPSGGLIFNPFHREFLNRVGQVTFSPGIFAYNQSPIGRDSSRKSTPNRLSLPFVLSPDTQGLLFPAEIDENPVLQLRLQEKLDTQCDDDVQDTIHSFFKSHLIAPSPDTVEQQPNADRTAVLLPRTSSMIPTATPKVKRKTTCQVDVTPILLTEERSPTLPVPKIAYLGNTALTSRFGLVRLPVKISKGLGVSRLLQRHVYRIQNVEKYLCILNWKESQKDWIDVSNVEDTTLASPEPSKKYKSLMSTKPIELMNVAITDFPGSLTRFFLKPSLSACSVQRPIDEDMNGHYFLCMSCKKPHPLSQYSRRSLFCESSSVPDYPNTRLTMDLDGQSTLVSSDSRLAQPVHSTYISNSSAIDATDCVNDSEDSDEIDALLGHPNWCRPLRSTDCNNNATTLVDDSGTDSRRLSCGHAEGVHGMDDLCSLCSDDAQPSTPPSTHLLKLVGSQEHLVTSERTVTGTVQLNPTCGHPFCMPSPCPFEKNLCFESPNFSPIRPAQRAVSPNRRCSERNVLATPRSRLFGSPTHPLSPIPTVSLNAVQPSRSLLDEIGVQTALSVPPDFDLESVLKEALVDLHSDSVATYDLISVTDTNDESMNTNSSDIAGDRPFLPASVQRPIDEDMNGHYFLCMSCKKPHPLSQYSRRSLFCESSSVPDYPNTRLTMDLDGQSTLVSSDSRLAQPVHSTYISNSSAIDATDCVNDSEDSDEIDALLGHPNWCRPLRSTDCNNNATTLPSLSACSVQRPIDEDMNGHYFLCMSCKKPHPLSQYSRRSLFCESSSVPDYPNTRLTMDLDGQSTLVSSDSRLAQPVHSTYISNSSAIDATDCVNDSEDSDEIDALLGHPNWCRPLRSTDCNNNATTLWMILEPIHVG
ncbi:hypothetical protein AHF37_05250 [Paragonimus kellicotti]|nr:hypothetical protein AHF37_05250 [Paragonimus kellicotti]